VGFAPAAAEAPHIGIVLGIGVELDPWVKRASAAR
jgi:hypothetical protein